MPGLNSKHLPWLLAMVMGAIGTFQYHLAQFTSGFDTFFGDRGDPRGIVALCEHWYQALSGKAQLLSPGLFYPIKGTLGYSEFLLGFGIPYSVLRSAGLSMFSSLETVIIVLTFLNYLACFVLLYSVLRFHLLASCAGAMLFAFSSPKFFQLSHLQLQFVVCLPLIFIFVIVAVRQAATLNQKRAFGLLFLAGLAFNVQLLTAFYFGWFFALWCFLFLLLVLILQSTRHFVFTLVRKYWPALAAASVTFLITAAPFMLVYLPRANESNWYTYLNVSEMIPEWWALLSMGDGNYLWGWMAPIVRPKPIPTYWGELTIGIGVLTSFAWIGMTVFAILIVVKNLRPYPVLAERQNEHRISPRLGLLFLSLMILATTIFYCLGIKYGDDASLWKVVYYLFPGAKAIRAMSRYVIFLTLPMAIAFAFALDYGIAQIASQKMRLRKAVLIVALVLISSIGVFEQFGVFKIGGTGFSKRIETAYLNAMAGKLSHDCAAFYVTVKPDENHGAAEYQYDAMLIAVMTGVPTLNGSSSQFPPGWFGLYQVKDPAYEENVKKWIELNKINGQVCRLELSPPVEAFESGQAGLNPFEPK